MILSRAASAADWFTALEGTSQDVTLAPGAREGDPDAAKVSEHYADYVAGR